MIREKNKKGLNIFPSIRKLQPEKLTLKDLWNGDELPYALKSSLAYIYYHHLRTSNVFRRNGNEIAHESLCNCLKRNIHSQPLLSIPMIYDVCSAVKAYVRDVPNGLMVKKFLKDWHRISRLNNQETIIKKMKSIIQKLPQANRNLLFNFLVLVSAIVKNQKENSMSPKSLSIVLLPSFFEKVVHFTNVKELPYFVELLEIMILNAKSLIDSNIFDEIEKSFTEIGANLIIQSQNSDEDKSLEETNRTQFVSLDSGLNSTSFLDDKTSNSLSSSSQAQVNYQENGNSMEDLLNDSKCIELHENMLRKSNSIQSLASSNTTNSDVSFLCARDNCFKNCNKSNPDGGFSCIGTEIHNINECRPFSTHDPISHCHNKWKTSEENTHCYKPVYDQSFFELGYKINRHNETVRRVEKPADPKSSYFIQRRKPINKRSSCTIVPVEMKNQSPSCFSSSTVTITSPSVISDLIRKDSLPKSSYSSHSSINSNISGQNIILKYKPKRNYNRNRFTTPISPSEGYLQSSSCLNRTLSLHKSNRNSVTIDE